MARLATTIFCFSFILLSSKGFCDDDKKAKAAYQEGNIHYASGEYKKAAESFENAYKLTARPLLLFNLANTYERSGDFAKASENLRAYLPDAPKNEKIHIRRRIANLNARANAKSNDLIANQDQIAKLEKSNQSLQLRVEDMEKNGRGPSYQREIILGATSVGFLAAGIIFGLAARNQDSAIEANCANSPLGTFCDESAQNDISSRNRFALASDISFGISAVAAIATTVLVLKKKKKYNNEILDNDSGSFVTGVTSGGLYMGYEGRF